MTINPNDIEIYTYNTGSGWFVRNNGITLRHKPTGIEASSSTERSQHKNKDIAWKELDLKVKAFKPIQIQQMDPTMTTLIRTFDIANISCGHKGCSIFTQLFDSLEDLYSYGFGAIYIEQVMTDRFADFFRRKSCTEVKDLASIPSFFYFLNR